MIPKRLFVALFGKNLRDVMGEDNPDHLVVARMKRGDKVFFPDLELPLQEGDELLIVTDVQHKDKARIIFGEEYPVNMNEWKPDGTKLVAARLSITKSAITGKSLRKLDVRRKYDVNLISLRRGGLVTIPRPDEPFQKGDVVYAVGEMKKLYRCFHIK